MEMNFKELIETCKDHIDRMSNECDANLEWMNDLSNLISLIENGFSTFDMEKDYLLFEFDEDLGVAIANARFNYLKKYFGNRVVGLPKLKSIRYSMENKKSLTDKLNNYIAELNGGE